MANDSSIDAGNEPTSKAPKTDNTIRPSRRRSHEKATEPADARPSKEETPGPRRRAAPAGSPKRLIPEHIQQRFVKVGHRYYFSDGAHAFTDRGARLVTGSENAEVVKSLISIA
jgi:hypothetical protein